MNKNGMFDCGEVPDNDIESLLDEFHIGRTKFKCKICNDDFRHEWNGKGNRPSLCGPECKRIAKKESQRKRRQADKEAMKTDSITPHENETLIGLVGNFLNECRNGDHPSVNEDMFYRFKLALHREDKPAIKRQS